MLNFLADFAASPKWLLSFSDPPFESLPSDPMDSRDSMGHPRSLMKLEALIRDRGVEFSVQNGESLLRLEIGERVSFNSQRFLYLWCASDRLFFIPKRKQQGWNCQFETPQFQQRNHDTWIITSNPSNKSLWIWSQHGGVLLMQVLYAIKFGWSDSMDSSVPWNFWLWGKFWRRNHTDTAAARLTWKIPHFLT